ncbi:hypothetical protein Efla_002525 [Eimeria flavescens]
MKPTEPERPKPSAEAVGRPPPSGCNPTHNNGRLLCVMSGRRRPHDALHTWLLLTGLCVFSTLFLAHHAAATDTFLSATANDAASRAKPIEETAGAAPRVDVGMSSSSSEAEDDFDVVALPGRTARAAGSKRTKLSILLQPNALLVALYVLLVAFLAFCVLKMTSGRRQKEGVWLRRLAEGEGGREGARDGDRDGETPSQQPGAAYDDPSVVVDEVFPHERVDSASDEEGDEEAPTRDAIYDEEVESQGEERDKHLHLKCTTVKARRNLWFSKELEMAKCLCTEPKLSLSDAADSDSQQKEEQRGESDSQGGEDQGALKPPKPPMILSGFFYEDLYPVLDSSSYHGAADDEADSTESLAVMLEDDDSEYPMPPLEGDEDTQRTETNRKGEEGSSEGQQGAAAAGPAGRVNGEEEGEEDGAAGQPGRPGGLRGLLDRVLEAFK